jgi:ferredoxin
VSHGYHLTPRSSNAKTGKIPVSTSRRETCPDACPFKKNGCYADNYHLSMHWDKVTRGERGGSLEVLCSAIAALPDNQLWRHNQAGDLSGEGDALDHGALRQLVAANRGKRGYTYTHKPLRSKRDRDAIARANRDGLTINLSGNTLEHADELVALGIAPVTVVLPSDAPKRTRTPHGNDVVTCPATYMDEMTCEKCGACAVASRRSIIGFPAHGSGAKRADLIARG